MTNGVGVAVGVTVKVGVGVAVGVGVNVNVGNQVGVGVLVGVAVGVGVLDGVGVGVGRTIIVIERRSIRPDTLRASNVNTFDATGQTRLLPCSPMGSPFRKTFEAPVTSHVRVLQSP